MDHKKLKLDELNRISTEEYTLNSSSHILVVLDNIRSAQNIGSIFRTADAFALQKIILTGISATPPNKEILKTALGSTESVQWEYYEQTLDCIIALRKQGYVIISAEQTENSALLHHFMPQKGLKYALVLGNEVEGVQQEVINESDHVVEIPQFGTKHSLNVSVSAGIIIWEFFQRLNLS